MDTLFVMIDYPQPNKYTSIESFEQTWFLDTYKRLRLVVNRHSSSMKIKLQDMIFNISIELNIIAFKVLLSKLEEICNVNINCPWAMNQENDHVKISIISHRNYKQNGNTIVLDEECICTLLDIRDFFYPTNCM